MGNPDFFLSKVFKLVDGAQHHEKYLFLNTLREIIVHNPKCLKPFIPKLLALLIEQTRNEDEQIRGIVAENLGRTYIYYSQEIGIELSKSLKSASPLERATVAKSFKFGASRETSSDDLQINAGDLIDLTNDKDI